MTTHSPLLTQDHSDKPDAVDDALGDRCSITTWRSVGAATVIAITSRLRFVPIAHDAAPEVRA